MPEAAVRPLEALERELRERMRGRRIVFEIGLDPGTVDEACQALAAFAQTDPGAGVLAGSRYPAVLLTYVVGEANRRYRHGALWPNLPIRELAIAELRESFETAIDSLGLEPFQQLADEGFRYVTPILAHGGIPVFCARDFWKKVVSELEEVPGADADELMRRWRSRPWTFDGIDKPVGRFLLHGGDVARNFLDRCIDLATSPADTVRRDFGLPIDVIEAFVGLERDDEVQRVGRGPVVPRPRLLLDPWDRGGPYIELPGAAPELGGAHWLLSIGGAEPVKVPCSRDRQQLPVPPANVWHVDFVSWPRTRPFDFEGTSGTVLVFDPSSGEQQTSTRAVVLREAWVLEPRDADLEVESDAGVVSPPTTLEHLPPLGGEWSSFVLRRIDLRNVHAIHARRPDGAAQVIRVVPPGARATLDREPVPGIASSAGNDVFDAAPAVSIPNLPGVSASRWSIEVQAASQVRRHAASELGGIGTPLDVSQLLPKGYLGEVHLAIFGPLGFDLRATFALAPGVHVTTAQSLLLPGDTGEVRITAEHGILVNGAPGPAVLPVSAESADVQVHLKRGSLELELRVRVPRLSWAVHGASSVAPLASHLIEIDAADVRDRKLDTLVIATERPGIAVTLGLCDEAQLLQTTDPARTSGERGRWRFPLDQFADTLTQSDAPLPEFVLQVASRTATLVRVRSRVNADVFGTRLVTRDDGRVLRLAYKEDRPIRRRIALLWPLDRPWDAPARSEVPDGTLGEAIFRPMDVPPGHYRAHVTASTGWIEPARPRPGDPNTRDVSVVGTPRRAGSPRDLLGVALETGRRPVALRDDVVGALTAEFVQAVEFLISEARDGNLPFRASFAARLLLGATASYPALTAAVARGELSRSRATQLIVLGMPLPRLNNSLSDDALRATWRSFSPLAAAIDVPAARARDEAALRRCRELLGWSPGDGLPAAASGLAPNGSWLTQSPEQIRSMYAARREDQTIAGMAEYLGASLEWIANARESPDLANAWWDLYGEALSLARPGADPRMKHYIARRSKARELPGTAAIPQATLSAADRLVASSPDSKLARNALWAAAAFAPRLVAYDLTLSILLHIAGPDEHIVEPPIPPSPAPSHPAPPSGRHGGAAQLADPRALRAQMQDIAHAEDHLRRWRERIMRAHEFYVFTDDELRRISVRRPRTLSDLKDVIKNPDKLARYGEEILRAIWGIDGPPR